MNLPPDLQIWTCPGCGNRFRILPGRQPPALCPNCRAASSPARPEPSPFEQLATLVDSDEPVDRPPPVTRVATPPEERAGEQADEPAGEESAIDIATKSRPRPTNDHRRVFVVMGAAIVVLSAWGLYGILKQTSRGTPGNAEVWEKAKSEVADWLAAPKTAEFPKPGEIKWLEGSDIPRWSVKSVVDAKNANGVPLRHSWFMEISYNPRRQKLEPDYIEIDDERVYASEATIRADREYAEKRAEKDKRAKKGRDKASQPKKRAEPARAARDETPARVDPLDEDRRESGKWIEIVRFSGRATEETKKFQVSLPAWRMRWVCEGEATIRLFNAARQQVGDEIDVGPGERGSRYVSQRGRDFSIGITTTAPWSIFVEE